MSGLRPLVATLALLALLLPTAARALDPALIESLRAGGYVLYFRHAQTDWTQSDRSKDTGWSSCAPTRMRQLSAAGRETARKVGEALRQLRIPVGQVLASEFCRTQETARLLGLGDVTVTPALINDTHAEHAGGTAALRDAAKRLMATPPPKGTNTVLVAHGNVFMLVSDRRPVEAGAAVLRPDGRGGFEVVTHVEPDEWIRLASPH